MKIILIFLAFILCSTYAPVYTDATLTGDGSIDTPLGINRGTELSPAQITTDKDDFDPTGWDAASYVRLDGDNGIRAITSMAAPDASTSPQEKTLINIGSYPLYFPGEHPDGTAANRIITDRDFILYPKQSCKIVYDNTSTRWRIVGEQNTEAKTGLFYKWNAGSNVGADYGEIFLGAVSGGAVSSLAGTTSLPAALELSTVASNIAGYQLYFGKGVAQFTAFGSAHIYSECLVSIPTLSDGTETFTAELQLTSGVSGTLEINNSYGIRYSHGIAGGDWDLFSQDNAGAESTDDLDVAVAAATTYKLGLYTDKGNTETRAYINGVYVGRVTSNMANSVACSARVIIKKSAGTTARTLNVHSFSAGAIYP